MKTVISLQFEGISYRSKLSKRKEVNNMYSMKEHYDEIAGEKLLVTLTDGTSYKGEYWGIISRLESSSGETELEIDTGEQGILRVFAESEIADVKVIE